MVVERRIGCELVGLSTDAKPDYPGLIDYRFYEVDTGNVFYYFGAAWSPVIGPADIGTFTNKTISALDNDFSRGVAVDFPLTFGYKRTGVMMPGVSGPYLAGSFGGMLVTTGSGQNPICALDNVEGAYQNFQANTTGEKMGIQSTTSTNSMITTRAQQPYLAVRARIDSTAGDRLYIGYTSNQTLPASNTPLASTDSGVMLGFGSANSTFMVYYNDGTTTAVSQNFGTTKDNNWHTFEIAMTITTVTCSIDGSPVLLSSQIPNVSTPLYLNCVAQYV